MQKLSRKQLKNIFFKKNLKMKNKSIFILSVFLVISLVSASGVSINPSHISINAFAGEDIFQNITITSDGTYALIINLSNSNGITISPSPIIVNEGENNVAIIFHIPTEISSQVYSEILSVGIQVPDSSGSSDGGGGIGGGGTKTIYKDKIIREIIYVNNTNQTDEINKKPQVPILIYNDKKIIKNLIIFGSLSSFVLIISLFYILQLRRKNIMKGGN